MKQMLLLGDDVSRKALIANHLKMFLRDMANEHGNKI